MTNKRTKALELLKQGVSKKEIASEVKISLSTLYAWINDSGIAQVNFQADEEHQKLVADYYLEHTLAETAKYFALSPPTVLRHAKRHGLTRAGKKIHAQGYFFGRQDRETLGLTEAQAKERNELLKSLGLDFQASEVDQCMYLVRGTKRFRLGVAEAIELTRDCRSFLKGNAQEIRTALGKSEG